MIATGTPSIERFLSIRDLEWYYVFPFVLNVQATKLEISWK